MPTNKESKKIFLKPGKTNKEDRMNFVKYWARYVKTHSDKEWSEQRNVIVNSQLQSAKAVSLTREQYLKIKKSGKSKLIP
ncbi:MAG: hypothetical protein Q8Q42_03065 [Nanoarchaeota archaeon]|nr:hypothetical protein [Nanoarchaeota archaeon]